MYKTIFSEMGIGQMQRGDKPDGVGKMQHEKFGIGKMQHYNDDKKKKNGSAAAAAAAAAAELEK